MIVAPRLPEFLARFPRLDVFLGVTDRSVDLFDEGVDCVVRVGDLADSGLVARSLGQLPIITVASPSYLAARGVPRTPDDLEGHAAVHYCAPTTGRPEPFEWSVEKSLQTRDLPGRVSVNGAEALIACGMAGLGLIQVPAYDVRSQLLSGELVEVLGDYAPSPMPMTLLFPHRRHLPSRTQIFADWLTEIIGQATDGTRAAPS